MSSLYSQMEENKEVLCMHKQIVLEGSNNKEDKDRLLKALGGIDFVLAYFLQQNVLNQKSLSKIKKILAAKYQLQAPDLNEMDLMLNEIEQNVNNEKKLNLSSSANHDDDDDDSKAEQAVFGQMQSPINIISTYMDGRTVKMSEEDFAANPLKFSYPQIVRDCTIENNGYTVQVNIAPSNKCTLSIRGKTYDLKQFHFHTPSEHMIDSKKHDMEMHLVHANEKGELAVLGFIFSAKAKYQRPKLELTKSRAQLVLSQACIPCNDDMFKMGKIKKTDEANDFLSQFEDQYPLKKTAKAIPLKRPISFDYLFETSSKNFIKNTKTNEINIDMEIFEYDGGLTTPPYSEGVSWHVSKALHFINNEQLNKLSACWGFKNNARECQKYCGRTVSVRNSCCLRINI